MVACPTGYVWRFYDWTAELLGQVRQLCGKTGIAADRGGRKGQGPDSKVHKMLDLH
jgi:hypothetical protein